MTNREEFLTMMQRWDALSLEEKIGFIAASIVRGCRRTWDAWPTSINPKEAREHVNSCSDCRKEFGRSIRLEKRVLDAEHEESNEDATRSEEVLAPP